MDIEVECADAVVELARDAVLLVGEVPTLVDIGHGVVRGGIHDLVVAAAAQFRVAVALHGRRRWIQPGHFDFRVRATPAAAKQQKRYRNKQKKTAKRLKITKMHFHSAFDYKLGLKNYSPFSFHENFPLQESISEIRFPFRTEMTSPLSMVTKSPPSKIGSVGFMARHHRAP